MTHLRSLRSTVRAHRLSTCPSFSRQVSCFNRATSSAMSSIGRSGGMMMASTGLLRGSLYSSPCPPFFSCPSSSPSSPPPFQNCHHGRLPLPAPSCPSFCRPSLLPLPLSSAPAAEEEEEATLLASCCAPLPPSSSPTQNIHQGLASTFAPPSALVISCASLFSAFSPCPWPSLPLPPWAWALLPSAWFASGGPSSWTQNCHHALPPG
mmetsp:Transcript_23508/g.61172  ORF Transcript_23508/g.61172 Transcript_23508/m.61172 type:complete len:208 (+) Transcript_23508:912-1535(+)